MDELKIDAAMMGRLAGALTFICGADHAATKALKKASETGADKDVKTARSQFLKLNRQNILNNKAYVTHRTPELRLLPSQQSSMMKLHF